MKWIILETRSLSVKTITLFKKLVFKLYIAFIEPKSTDENVHRKELVCNILLTFILALTIILNVLVLKSFIDIGAKNYTGINPFIMSSITGSTLCLLYLSRKGYVSIVSHTMIWILVVGCTYGQITWGADLPSVILLWCFIITASSILISTRYSFFLTLAIGLSIIMFQILENNNVFKPFKAWKNTPFRLDDAVEYAVVFTLIAGVSWISNREIFKSLLKVKASQLELQNEKESLEIKVIERTKELHQAQVDKINGMYQLVEFGRISSGLFHDLMTPLNTLSLTVRQIGKIESIECGIAERSKLEIKDIEKQIEMCLRTSSRIIDFINLAKRQIQHTDDTARFEIGSEIQNTISLLQSKARQKNVLIKYCSHKKVHISGSPTLFSHIVTNLISNAIDAYQHKSPNDSLQQPLVLIYVQRKHKQVEIKIRDFGCGIPPEIQSKIFDPFFTTKSIHGCGIGLSATKHTLEKYFRGTIHFHSSCSSDYSTNCSTTRDSLGTTFIIKIPLSNQQDVLSTCKITEN